MSSPITALLASYNNPTRQLGAVSTPQLFPVNPASTSEDEVAKIAITNTVFPPSERVNRAGWNSGALQVIIDALDAGYLTNYYGDRAAGDCAQANKNGNTTLTMANKAAALGGSIAALGIGTAAHASALATIGIGINIAPVVGQIISGALLAFAAVSSIFQHHAQAVAQEQTILCYIIPQINQAVLNLDAAIAKGDISLQDAYNGLDSLQNAYVRTVQPILQETASTCNAACVEHRAVLALMLYKKYQYGKVVALASPVTAIANNISAATGLPIQTTNTLVYVIAAVLLFLIARSL